MERGAGQTSGGSVDEKRGSSGTPVAGGKSRICGQNDQERTILFYLEQADDSLAFLKKETESRTKLYRSLGMAAGLFILVLFA